MKKVLAGLLLVFLLPIAVQAEDYTYTITNNTIDITGYIGTNTAATIPDTINGLSVNSIGTNAFAYCTNLTSITIPNSVTIIRSSAFRSCTSLTNFTIPNRVTSIGPSAFYGCTSLTSIIIPDSVTAIWSSAFNGCTSLTNFTIPNRITDIRNSTFNDCTSLTSVIIPNSVTNIGDWAFMNCASLAGITIPDSVTSIDGSAFYGCASLTSVTIPDNVTIIWSSTFYGCTSLTSVTIPNSVTNIGSYAFAACTSLTSIMIPDSVTSIGSYAFQNCVSLGGVYFSGKAPGVGINVFSGANNATVYHFSGTIGWPTVSGLWAGRTTALWLTVNGGADGGSYTNLQAVTIIANAPAAGMTFNRWIGNTQPVASTTSSTTTVALPAEAVTLTATYINLPGYYTLTVNNGTGGGAYTSGTQVAISAGDLRSGVTFKAWIGDTQYVNNVTYTNALVTLSTNPVSLTATYYYALTVNSGTGDGSYTNRQQVAIAADAPAAGMTFDRWTGDTQYVNNDTYTNALVTMSTNPVSLSATYKILPGYYTLTVSNGTGGGIYSNGVQVAIAADAPAIGKAFVRWTGDTAYVADSNSASTTVTMPASNITVRATYKDISYVLTVITGNGTGSSYTNGQRVAISADLPDPGKTFDQWTGTGAPYLANVTASNTLVTMPASNIAVQARYKNITNSLTVNSGSGGGWYVNGQQVAIVADAPAGTVFDRWIGDTQYVNNVTYTNALVTMSTNPVSLTATYYYIYALTVTGGSGSGSSYTNAQVVDISADAPITGMTFDQWTGDTQYVASVSSANTTVTMPAQAVALNATYKILPGWYTLTVSNGTGGGLYSNGVQVTVKAVAPEGTAFDRWTGDTQYAAGVFSLSTIVTMPASNVALTASCVDASNGVASVEWAASAGFYFAADPYVGILGDATGNSTIAQLMYSPDDVKDSILPGRVGAVNDVVWDTITLTENGIPGDYDDYAYFAAQNCTRAFTNGYVYALIFQDNQVQPGDWYYSTPLLAIDTNTSPQSIEMNTDVMLGDAIDGANGAQVIEGSVTYTLTANGGIGGTVSPASTNVLSGGNATFVVTASNYYRIATLTTNGTAVTGMTFDNNSTTTNFIWNNVQAAGTVTVAFVERAMLPPFTAHGTPYSWLASYGLTNYEVDDLLDQDMDGLKTWQEYITGTVPNNATSVLKAVQTTRNIVTWSPVSGRVYSVYWSTNLMKGFQPLETNIPWTRTSFTNSTTVPRGFYKIDVRLE